jgi:hypothetical protein
MQPDQHTGRDEVRHVLGRAPRRGSTADEDTGLDVGLGPGLGEVRAGESAARSATAIFACIRAPSGRAPDGQCHSSTPGTLRKAAAGSAPDRAPPAPCSVSTTTATRTFRARAAASASSTGRCGRAE